MHTIKDERLEQEATAPQGPSFSSFGNEWTDAGHGRDNRSIYIILAVYRL